MPSNYDFPPDFPKTRTLIISAPVNSGFGMSRTNAPVYNEAGELTGYEKGKLILELPSDVVISSSTANVMFSKAANWTESLFRTAAADLKQTAKFYRSSPNVTAGFVAAAVRRRFWRATGTAIRARRLLSPRRWWEPRSWLRRWP